MRVSFRPTTVAMRAAVLAAVMALSACVGGSDFRTFYPEPVATGVSRAWRVVDVQVTAPRSLRVSEARTYLPDADIVWREDPASGNRYEQVEKIVADAARDGTAGLHGARPVVLQVTLSRFHAMTFEAESLSFAAGVHDIEFTAQVVDARSGAVLTGPTFIEASLPAHTGGAMAQLRAQGDSQKKQISRHLRSVFAGWLGIGPDPRQTFTRTGG